MPKIDVLDASGQTSRGNTVNGIKATFEWKAAEDSMKSITVRRTMPATFDFLMELVDEAPCWATEEGKCLVVVEPTLS